MSLEKFSNILGADTAKKVYEDGLSDSTKEVGKTLTDIIKSARLFTFPFQLLATYQNRLSAYLQKVQDSVPQESQIQSAPEICGPVIENLRFVREGSYLEGLYLNLLMRSIDKDRVDEAHPAFVKIIEQLSRDEAYILSKIKKEGCWANYETDLNTNEKKNSFCKLQS
jgi:hypothetical protein